MTVHVVHGDSSHTVLYIFYCTKDQRELEFYTWRWKISDKSLAHSWHFLNVVASLFVFLTEALDLNNLFIFQLNFTMVKLFLRYRINFDEVMSMRDTLSYSFMTPFFKVHKCELWFTYLLWQLRRWHWYILVFIKNIWTFWYLWSWFSGLRESENGSGSPLMLHCYWHLSPV